MESVSQSWLLKKLRMRKPPLGHSVFYLSCFIPFTSQSPQDTYTHTQSFSSHHIILTDDENGWHLLSAFCARHWLGTCILLISLLTVTLEDNFSTHLIEERIGIETERELVHSHTARKGQTQECNFMSLHYPRSSLTFLSSCHATPSMYIV